MAKARIFFTGRKDAESPDKVKPSHHDLPKDPGSDLDHHHKEERERDRKRSWDEHHPNNPSRPK